MLIKVICNRGCPKCRLALIFVDHFYSPVPKGQGVQGWVNFLHFFPQELIPLGWLMGVTSVPWSMRREGCPHPFGSVHAGTHALSLSHLLLTDLFPPRQALPMHSPGVPRCHTGAHVHLVRLLVNPPSCASSGSLSLSAVAPSAHLEEALLLWSQRCPGGLVRQGLL